MSLEAQLKDIAAALHLDMANVSVGKAEFDTIQECVDAALTRAANAGAEAYHALIEAKMREHEQGPA